MNTKLINYIVLIIEQNILLKREEKSFYPPIEDYINITRDERISQQDEIINECFKKRK